MKNVMECDNTSKSDTKSGNKFCKKVNSYFKEYCNSTSIHGFRYFGENRTVFEKVIWIIFFTSSLSGCVFAIYNVYSKWSSSPVIVTFANKGMPIHEIPFPAVTVCSESKIKGGMMDVPELYDKAVSAGKTLNATEERYFNYLVPMCRYDEDKFGNVSQLEDNDDIFEAMEEIAPQFEITECKIWGLTRNCSDIFSEIVTDEGPCYTFNLVDRNEMFTENVVHRGEYHVMGANSTWNPEHGYSETAGIDTYPMRALLSGARYSLQFDLKLPKKDVDAFCRQAEEGFRVLVHSPLRIPRMSEQFVMVPYDHRVTGSIRPSTITTSTTVRKYHPKKRRCYFPSEQKLGYFRTYSSKNCAFECLTNFTLELCKCVDFYMPRFNGTRICGASDYECMKVTECINMFQVFVLQKEVKGDPSARYVKFPEGVEQVIGKCDCMPMCSDVEYHVGISQSPWPWEKDYEYLNETMDYHLTRFSLYFISNSFIGSERNELYGPIDFLANFGGILGLFTGFSVLSLMEIVYFLSIRMLCNTRLYKNWSGPP